MTPTTAAVTADDRCCQNDQGEGDVKKEDCDERGAGESDRNPGLQGLARDPMKGVNDNGQHSRPEAEEQRNDGTERTRKTSPSDTPCPG
ncbi:hypothetical protein GJ654_20155 [Rhodoblastus acidophilus]|uniref:Uncharacterized protein n=1 Tax=Rhodoblastus acidophilus TaxID=1074 RepID=A0A6N8DWQ3_RHOAC|nr:hypothetical protein [Rhodoblastus acidophilus]MTV33294.1 hypothetical protein [Rhodoblastus acidophilus]